MRRWLGAGLIGAALGAACGLGWIAGSDSAAHAGPPKEGYPPDPAPIAANKQWVFEIQAKESVPNVVKVTELTIDKAQATPRMMGRWALEFYVGRELLDRLRFNVPGSGADYPEKERGGRKRPVFRINTKFFLRMADHERTTLVRLVDRATGDIRLFSWPPDKDGKLLPLKATVAAPSADAGDAGSNTPDGDSGRPDGGDAGRYSPDKP